MACWRFRWPTCVSSALGFLRYTTRTMVFQPLAGDASHAAGVGCESTVVGRTGLGRDSLAAPLAKRTYSLRFPHAAFFAMAAAPRFLSAPGIGHSDYKVLACFKNPWVILGALVLGACLAGTQSGSSCHEGRTVHFFATGIFHVAQNFC